MYGPAGTGKTCAALALLDHVAGPTCYYGAWEWSQRLTDAAFGRVEERRSPNDVVQVTPHLLRERLRFAALFVLDELGTRGEVKDGQCEAVKDVLDARHGRPLVCLSNKGLRELARIYDDRVADRLGGGTVVELAGQSRRGVAS